MGCGFGGVSTRDKRIHLVSDRCRHMSFEHLGSILSTWHSPAPKSSPNPVSWRSAHQTSPAEPHHPGTGGHHNTFQCLFTQDICMHVFDCPHGPLLPWRDSARMCVRGGPGASTTSSPYDCGQLLASLCSVSTSSKNGNVLPCEESLKVIW